MSTRGASSIILRTAVVWGTAVLAVRDLRRGQSLGLGDRPNAIFPKPEGMLIADFPIRAVANHFEVDARGATGGILRIQGRSEDPARMSGTPIALRPGDHGLVQYGSFGIFFQVIRGAPQQLPRARLPWRVVFAFLFALATLCGGLTLLAIFSGRRALEKPMELSTLGELAGRFRKHAVSEMRAVRVTNTTAAFSGAVAEDVDELRRALAAIPSGRDPLGGFGTASARTSDQASDGGADAADNDIPSDEAKRFTAKLDKVVKSKKEAFFACYAVGRSDNPRLAGDLTVTWSINSSGIVEGARIARSTIANPRVEACVLGQIQKLRFRAADETPEASFTFTFPPKD